MVKDVSDEHAAASAALARFSYHTLETDPDMILDLAPRWRSYEDCLASLTSKYRRMARRIEKDVEAAGCRVEELPDVEAHAAELHGLYMQTHTGARRRLMTLPPEFIPTLAARLGEEMRCAVVRREGRLVGFVTNVRDGELAVGYDIGFDRAANAEFPVYFRLLQAVVADAIKPGCRRLSFGRTAPEPKARLGARPAPTRVWIRRRVPALNLLVRALLCAPPRTTRRRSATPLNNSERQQPSCGALRMRMRREPSGVAKRPTGVW